MDGRMDHGRIGGMGRENGQRKTWGDVQVITQYAHTGDAHCEEVITQISIAAKNASECLVAVFFCVCTWMGKWSKLGHPVMYANAKVGATT